MLLSLGLVITFTSKLNWNLELIFIDIIIINLYNF